MDIRIIDEIWAFRKYDYFGHKVKPGSTVLDIGANIGVFSVYAVTECGAARVLAFEPQRDNLRLLKKNVQANGLSDVTCVNAAVSSSTGVANLHVAPDNSGAHRLTSASGPSTLEVPTVTLGDALNEYGVDHVDYLKLDCEGAEYEIIESAAPDLLARIDQISMEYHPVDGHGVEDLVDKLSKHGFSVRVAERDRLYATRRTAVAEAFGDHSDSGRFAHPS